MPRKNSLEVIDHPSGRPSFEGVLCHELRGFRHEPLAVEHGIGPHQPPDRHRDRLAFRARDRNRLARRARGVGRATAEELRANDYNLSAGRYRPLSQTQIEHRDPRELLDELAAIETEISDEIEGLKEALKADA